MTINTENLSPKLIEIMQEIINAVEKMSTIRTNPKDIIAVAKTIEKGEKNLIREYDKRIKAIKEANRELEQIAAFAAKMGYTLTETDPEPETDVPVDDTPSGITITIE